MNLAIDIGNTRVKMGLFSKNVLKGVFSKDADIENILEVHKIKKVIISKTADNAWIESILKRKKIKPLILSHQLKLPVKILYKTPQTLGADRIAGSVAAQALYPGNNILKIDFGTCITYDFINDKGEYPGGLISPGMMIRIRAVHNYTANLPLVDPMQAGAIDLIGTDTGSSIASGVVNGIKEEALGIIKEFNQRFGSLKVVATGGDMGFFVTLLKSKIFASPYLVLEGLNRILNYNT